MGVPESRNWCWASTAAGTRWPSAAKTWVFRLTAEQLDTVYHRFTALADRKKGLRNDEIVGPGARSGGRDASRRGVSAS